jgi:hypothetical protein
MRAAAKRGTPVPNLLDQLRDQRAAARTTQDGILHRAATEQRDLTPDELAEHTARSVEPASSTTASNGSSATRSPSSAPPPLGPPAGTSPASRS